MAEPARLQKAIAHAGLMSRRSAEELIAAGRVTIDGRVAILGDRVDVDVESVEVDGAPLPIKPGLETHLLYKPLGVISTADDPHGRSTVVDMVPSGTRLYPVGRLDADSEGLILLTNDGTLADRVTHPRYGVRKRYLAQVSGSIKKSDLKRLVDGVDLEDGPAAAMAAKVVGSNREATQVEIIMGEGRNREVRRMFDVIGHPVDRLVRTAIGPISDPALKPGESRRLSNEEVAFLMAESAEDTP